ncbi:hypothetical protein [Haloechinothrix sp. LS1_15]|uniref:hypothetical protein n=1 Tax=Haloechinothrix sp. LS1_15 TaxID=2652248 RepID=UPI00294544DF|nr:hypothetical protein [Haloechinothrix sp. LS1_15]MDV6014513.1 hypothetical protein [Haloechinothrix sp. LS1_15]
MVRTATALPRLLDVLSLLADDRRVQVTFTYDSGNPARFHAGLREHLEAIQARVIPWRDATQRRFDLAIAASENDRLAELDAHVLLLPHGLGFQKYYPRSHTIAGMDAAQLLDGDRVVPAAIGLSHHAQRHELDAACPQALPHATVIGDPCYDRMLVSRHRTRRYRAALDAQRTTLVLLTSTWGPDSLYATWPELPERLVGELPLDAYTVALSLHPGVWSAHGPYQVRAWLDHARRCGLRILPASEGWRAALLSADVVIGDEGSLSSYAAALDKPVMLATRDSATTVPGSLADALRSRAPALDRALPLRTQLDDTIATYVPGSYRDLAAVTIEYRGESAGVLRDLCYRLMELDEPDRPSRYPPVPDPEAETSRVASIVAGGRITGTRLAIERYPSRVDLPDATAISLPNQHVTADLDEAHWHELDSATVLHTDHPVEAPGTVAAEQLRRWPAARAVACGAGDGTCTVAFRDGTSVRVHTAATPPPDTALLATAAYLCRVVHGELPDRQRIETGPAAAEIEFTHLP